MSSVAMSKIQIVVIMLVKAFTAAPAEHHGKTSFKVGGEEGEEQKHLKGREHLFVVPELELMAPTYKGIAVGVPWLCKRALPNQQPCAPQLEGAQRPCVRRHPRN
jgi:hypothetical protein